MLVLCFVEWQELKYFENFLTTIKNCLHFYVSFVLTILRGFCFVSAPREDWFQPSLRWIAAIRTVISKATKWLLMGILRVSLKSNRCEMLVTSNAVRAKQSQKARNSQSRPQFSCEKNAFIKNLWDIQGKKRQANLGSVWCNFTCVPGSLPFQEECSAYNACREQEFPLLTTACQAALHGPFI